MRAKLARYLLRRVAYLIPQLAVISFATFMLVHLLPGNPAIAIAGSFATPAVIASIEARLGLNLPIYEQYWHYLISVVHGDFGQSLYTRNSVSQDLAHRLPATLELITVSLIAAILIGIPLSVLAVLRRGSVGRVVKGYGLLAGALPDFWLGLILILVFYTWLGWSPAPIGQLSPAIVPPDQITGSLLVDSVLGGRWDALSSHLAQMTLPVATLTFVYMGPILKMSQSTFQTMMNEPFIDYARSMGLKTSTIVRYALRNSLPPVVTIIAVIYGFLIGGAVLVETIYGWNGIGQYAVEAIRNSDFAPIQAVVLVTTLFTVAVYLVLDLTYLALDPRLK
jgi:peptide/nickel transport system permease protein